jgi:D-alanyl-D-alanine carboxypeptidase
MMKRRIAVQPLSTWTFSLAISLCVLAGTVSGSDRFDTNAGVTLFEHWLQAKMAYEGWPGVSVGVVSHNALIYSKGFGLSDTNRRSRASAATLYRIGSITKLFTATAILKLNEDGKIDLDDPIIRYVPNFRIRNPFAGSTAITIRHLLTHSSGLPAEAPLGYWTDSHFPSFPQLLAAIADQELQFPPETHIKYSNLGYALLGQIASTVAGESFERYVRDTMLMPLGMSSTAVLPGPDVRQHLAVGYGRRMPDGTREIRPFEDLSGLTAAGNMSSNVDDLALFIESIFRSDSEVGVHVLREATWQRMQRVGQIRPEWQGGFGLGFEIQKVGQHVYVGHEGWVSGYHTRIRLSPADKMAVIVLANSDDADTDLIASEAFKLLSPGFTLKYLGSLTVSTADRPEQFIGQYGSPWADTEILLIDGALRLIFPRNPDPSGTMLTLIPMGRGRFRAETDLEDYNGETVTFEFGPNGLATRFNLTATWFQRRS